MDYNGYEGLMIKGYKQMDLGLKDLFERSLKR